MAHLLKLFPFILVFILQGCGGGPQQPWVESTYEPLPPLRLDVVSVDVEKDYIPPEEPPFVDHRFNIPPVDRVETWAKRYLQAVGRVGRAVVHIEEASVVEHFEERERTKFIPYTGKIALQIEFIDQDGKSQGFTRVAVTRTHHLPLNMAEPNRQRAWKAMVDDMFANLEPLVQRNIYKHTPQKLIR